MVYVRIELWPHGDRAKARLLQEVVIANTGGDPTTGEYSAKVCHSTTYKGDGFADPNAPAASETWRSAAKIKHRRSDSPAHLVMHSLRSLLTR